MKSLLRGLCSGPGRTVGDHGGFRRCGLVQFQCGERGFKAGRFLVEADAHFGGAGKEGCEDEPDESCAGGDSAENPLRADALDHEAERKEGEGEPKAKELSGKGAWAVYRGIFVEAHRCTNDGCNREEPGKKPNSEETEYVLR